MGNNPEQLLASLQGNAIYPTLFKQAFPNSNIIGLDQVLLSLAAFQSSLISLNSRYDRYAHGYHQALNSNEMAGLNIFRSFVARCAECHQPPLFTNNQIAVIGVAEKNGEALDIGAQKTFNAVQLRGGFKVPTLRNIAQTAPYMHAGNFSDLRESVEFYNKGRGHAVPKGEKLQLHWHIWEPNLSSAEIDLIVEFLGSLTDETLSPQIPKAVPSGLAPVDDNFHSNNTINLAKKEK
jgi:cytochrome c peroxidase